MAMSVELHAEVADNCRRSYAVHSEGITLQRACDSFRHRTVAELTSASAMIRRSGPNGAAPSR